MFIATSLAGCTLRSWQAQDKTELLRCADNRRIWRNLTDLFPHPYTAADADFWIAFANRAAPSIHLAIERAGVVVGGIGVIVGEGHSRYTGAFGYWLGEAYWGQGVATIAARALVAHVFSATHLVRLEARVFEWNPASMRVLEKTGFVREGVSRRSVFKDGQLIDSVVYALIKPT